MKHNYMYGFESVRYTFISIPQKLVTDPEYKHISTDAKLLYGLMLNRTGLSKKNQWIDSARRVFIYYTLEDIMDDLNCANGKATKMIRELEEADLIERKRQGQGKPTIIYVKDFAARTDIEASDGDPPDEREYTGPEERNDVRSHENRESEPAGGGVTFQTHENRESGFTKTVSQDSRKSGANNIEKNNTEKNINPIFSFPAGEKRKDEMGSRSVYQDFFEKQLCLDALRQDNPGETGCIDEIRDILADVCSSGKEYVTISGDRKPRDAVAGVLEKLEMQHIQYVLDSMSRNTTKIRNVRQYLLAALYNAPMTMHNYYKTAVNADYYGTG